jgi:rhomboid family GlyGly-CTERM serine protease
MQVAAIVAALVLALRRILATIHADGRRGALLLALLCVLAALATGGERVLLALRFDRDAVADGEAWRLLTGHFVHLGAQHLLADGAGLVLLWALFARSLPPREWAWVLGASLVAVDAGLWWLTPGIAWFAGISGLLHGAWAAGAAAGTARREPVAVVLLLVLVAKLAWEDLHGTSLVTEGFPVVTTSHLHGAAGALLALGLLRMREKRRKPL